MTRLSTLLGACLFVYCTTVRAVIITPGGVVFVAEPGLATPTVGATFAVEVRGKEFPNSIDGGGLNITFDSRLLPLIGITPAPPWADFFSPGTRSDADGTVNDIYFNNLDQAGVEGEFPIVTLTFSPIRTGTAQIQLAEDDVFIFGRLEEQFVPQFLGRQVLIPAVPEPALSLAMFIGIIVLLARLCPLPLRIGHQLSQFDGSA